jgi:hypothetical protein
VAEGDAEEAREEEGRGERARQGRAARDGGAAQSARALESGATKGAQAEPPETVSCAMAKPEKLGTVIATLVWRSSKR